MSQALYWVLHTYYSQLPQGTREVDVTGSILQLQTLRLRQGMDLLKVTQLMSSSSGV